MVTTSGLLKGVSLRQAVKRTGFKQVVQLCHGSLHIASKNISKTNEVCLSDLTSDIFTVCGMLQLRSFPTLPQLKQST